MAAVLVCLRTRYFISKNIHFEGTKRRFFNSFGLENVLVKRLKNLRIEKPTAIQEKVRFILGKVCYKLITTMYTERVAEFISFWGQNMVRDLISIKYHVYLYVLVYTNMQTVLFFFNNYQFKMSQCCLYHRYPKCSRLREKRGHSHIYAI